MKRLFALLALTCSGVEAAPVPADLLAKKSNNTGHVIAGAARSETCELYANRIVIKRGYGHTISTEEVVAIRLGGDLRAVIAEAAGAPVEKTPNGLCDGPSTSVSGFQGGKSFVLYTTGGCSRPSIRRTGFASGIITDILDQHCPRTIEVPVFPDHDRDEMEPTDVTKP